MMSRMSSYDYIFSGTGAAALSLLCRMSDHPFFQQKKILLLDKSPKNTNDRTWCFWEEQPGYFEPLVYRRWSALSFFSRHFSSQLKTDAYEYKMIRGIDFYRHCSKQLQRLKGLEWKYGHLHFENQSGQSRLFCDGQQIQTEGAILFNSIYQPSPATSKTIDLLQHFKGWIIETPKTVFDPQRATLMDFRVSQSEGASFVYVLPISDRSALVEYTLFTEKLLEPGRYDSELSAYIQQYITDGSYEVKEVEFGVIPMTNRKFHFYGNGIFNIGTAGGQTKASSGYTFRFIQKQSDRLLESLLKQEPLQHHSFSPGRFHFYDDVLLRVLKEKHPPGDEVFARLFQRNAASSIFRFLDNETSLPQELNLISTLPFFPFLRSAVKGFLK